MRTASGRLDIENPFLRNVKDPPPNWGDPVPRIVLGADSREDTGDLVTGVDMVDQLQLSLQASEGGCGTSETCDLRVRIRLPNSTQRRDHFIGRSEVRVEDNEGASRGPYNRRRIGESGVTRRESGSRKCPFNRPQAEVLEVEVVGKRFPVPDVKEDHQVDALGRP